MQGKAQYAIFILLALLLSVSLYFVYTQHNTIEEKTLQIFFMNNTINDQEQTIGTQSNTISDQRENIAGKESTIQDQQKTITGQKSTINDLNSEVESLGGQLNETSAQLEYALPFEERGEQGMYVSKAYHLLADYDASVPIAKSITVYGTLIDDLDLWSRAGDVYNWLGSNYKYCSDKGFCVSDKCYQIQFFSPDELLVYSGKDVFCGDCDDNSHIFAGLLYASGVPHNKVAVACGKADGIGHCWNALYLNNSWHYVDTVCAKPSLYIEYINETIELQQYPFPDSIENVLCFNHYDVEMWYTAEGFNVV